jgi:hypothetical protein
VRGLNAVLSKGINFVKILRLKSFLFGCANSYYCTVSYRIFDSGFDSNIKIWAWRRWGKMGTTVCTVGINMKTFEKVFSPF